MKLLIVKSLLKLLCTKKPGFHLRIWHNCPKKKVITNETVSILLVLIHKVPIFFIVQSKFHEKLQNNLFSQANDPWIWWKTSHFSINALNNNCPKLSLQLPIFQFQLPKVIYNYLKKIQEPSFSARQIKDDVICHSIGFLTSITLFWFVITFWFNLAGFLSEDRLVVVILYKSSSKYRV